VNPFLPVQEQLKFERQIYLSLAVRCLVLLQLKLHLRHFLRHLLNSLNLQRALKGFARPAPIAEVLELVLLQFLQLLQQQMTALQQQTQYLLLLFKPAV